MHSQDVCEAVCSPRNDSMYVDSTVRVTENNDESQRRQYFLNRINELFWTKRRELEVLAGFDSLEKIKYSFQDAIWAETDPSKLPALLAQFDATAVKQATFSAEKMGLNKLFS